MDQSDKTQYADVASWELSDSMWERIALLLPKSKSRFRGRGRQRRNIGGRPAAEPRKLMSGILYVLRTGCQWNALPQEFGPSGKTAHRYFQRWVRAGVFKRMWQAGLNEYDELKGIEWKWQAADGAITKAPLGGEKTGKNPTDRGKTGTKRSLLVNAQGLPLGLVVSGANTPDGKLLEPTLLAIPVERPDPKEAEQHLSLDKGYSGEPCATTAETQGYTLHVPDKANTKKTQAPTWAAQAAPMDCRSCSLMDQSLSPLACSLEKKVSNYLSLLYFACAIICWRKCEV
jgi:putative transposase